MAGRGGCGCIGFIFKLVFWLLAMGVVAYIVLFGYLLLKEYTQARPGSYEAIIVLGAQVDPNGQPSVQLEWRLEKALEMYKNDPKPIIVTGARGDNEPATEASIMKAWLVWKGVPENMIQMDETSMNTRENIKNAMKLLPQGTMDVLIVTSDYHLPRALQIARDLGLNPSGAASPIKQEYWLKNHARETLAWGKYILQKFVPIP
ncbi:MAG: YdcF family protein [Bacillota bacterium]|nr:YdcF family protein [Bacillota bacterium]